MAPAALPSGCGFCDKKDNLLRCSGCKVMYYCGRDHQAAHRPSHKSACKAIRAARLVMEREEADLHNFQGTVFIPTGDLFVTSVGMFGRIPAARPYMQSRAVLAHTLSHIQTVESLAAQLDHYLDLLRLCCADCMNVRGRVPPLFLRLNKDQELYDFLKWQVVMSSDDTWDPRDWNRLFLNLKHADAFEPIEDFLAAFPDLHRCIAITFLKIKLLLDLKRLEESAAVLSAKLPQELVDLIQSFVPHSPIVAGNRELILGDRRHEAIKKLEGEIQILWMATKLRNQHFWPNLLNPDRDSTLQPDRNHWGTVEEARAVRMSVYDAWRETPGAIDFLRKISQESG